MGTKEIRNPHKYNRTVRRIYRNSPLWEEDGEDFSKRLLTDMERSRQGQEIKLKLRERLRRPAAVVGETVEPATSRDLHERMRYQLRTYLKRKSEGKLTRQWKDFGVKYASQISDEVLRQRRSA